MEDGKNSRAWTSTHRNPAKPRRKSDFTSVLTASQAVRRTLQQVVQSWPSIIPIFILTVVMIMLYLTCKPPSMNAWMAQCALYVFLMVIVKICITLLIQFQFWDQVRKFILSPFHNPKIEVAFVMLIIPFFVNLLMFWVTDNFLMHRSKRERRSRRSNDRGLLNRVKVRYRAIRGQNTDTNQDSDTDELVSADEELLGSFDTSIQQRSVNAQVT